MPAMIIAPRSGRVINALVWTGWIVLLLILIGGVLLGLGTEFNGVANNLPESCDHRVEDPPAWFVAAGGQGYDLISSNWPIGYVCVIRSGTGQEIIAGPGWGTTIRTAVLLGAVLVLVTVPVIGSLARRRRRGHADTPIDGSTQRLPS